MQGIMQAVSSLCNSSSGFFKSGHLGQITLLRQQQLPGMYWVYPEHAALVMSIDYCCCGFCYLTFVVFTPIISVVNHLCYHV